MYVTIAAEHFSAHSLEIFEMKAIMPHFHGVLTVRLQRAYLWYFRIFHLLYQDKYLIVLA